MLLLTAAALAVAGAGQSMKSPDVISYRNIALYPISAGLSNSSADVITLDEGIKAGTVIITEAGSAPPLVRRRPGRNNTYQQPDQPSFNSGAQVNTLWLTNNSGRTLLLIAGEMVIGGQQDRIIQKDGLIPPSKRPTDLSVFCVEHGRWTGTSQSFGSVIPATQAGRAAFAGGGAAGGLAAPSGGRRGAVVTKSQQRVWDDVANQNSNLGTAPSTGTYRENYVSPKTQPVIDTYIKALAGRFPVGESAGVAVAVNGRLIWMDRFDSRATFAKYWPKLLKSYILEAMASRERGDIENPSFRDAMHFAKSRDGSATFEGEEGVSKLTTIENDRSVLSELTDLQTAPPDRRPRQ